MDIEEIAAQIVDAGFKVHSTLGPGLLESSYQACLSHELRKRGFKVETEVPLPVIYDEIKIDVGYRIDMLVEGCVVIENKSVEEMLAIHEAQVITYLKLGGFQLAFLINWNVKLFKSGVRRIAYHLPEPQWQLNPAVFHHSDVQNIPRHDRHQRVGRSEERGDEIQDHGREDDRPAQDKTNSITDG